LWGWGFNYFGTIGDNTSVDRTSPVQISSSSFTSVVDGGYSQHGAAVKSDGTLWTWGQNSYGQLGVNNTFAYSSPIQVGGNTWEKAYKLMSTLAYKTDGSLWSWGNNSYGQLGTGDKINKSSPVQIMGTSSGFYDISLSFSTGAAVKKDGTLWTWGSNSSGELGLGDKIHRSSPTQVGIDTTWRKVATPFYATIAIKSDGTMWGCGEGANYGMNGKGNGINYSSMVQIGTDNTWASITGTYLLVHAVKTDGSVWVWGQGGASEAGTAVLSNPTQIITGKTFQKVVTGLGTSAGLTTDGKLWLWGQNSYGSMLDLPTSSSPTQVLSDSTWTDIAPNFAGFHAIKG
jgi:alpha-tubulin suppressor-like RCC1 family protein